MNIATKGGGVRLLLPGLALASATTVMLVRYGVPFVSPRPRGYGQYELHGIRRADPTFAVGDWFIEQTTSYHYTHTSLVAWAAGRGHLDEYLTALLFLTPLLLLLAAFVMFRAIGERRDWVLAAPVLMLLEFGVRDTWGSQSLQDPWHGLAVLSLAMAATGRWRTSAALGVLAFYGHFSVGIWLFLLLGILWVGELASGRMRLRQPLALGTASVLLLSPLLLRAGSDFLSRSGAADYGILFFLRSPHHYSFLDFGTYAHARAVVVLLVAVAAEAVLKPLHRRLRLAIWSMVFLQLGGFVFLELLEWPLYLRLFPYRVAPWLTFMAVVLSVRLATDRAARWPSRALGLLSVLTLLALERPGLMAAVGSAFARFVVPAIWILIGITAVVLAVMRRGVEANRIATATLLTAALLVPAYIGVREGSFESLATGREASGAAIDSFGSWVQSIVPVGEVVLIPPDQTNFRVSTSRGVVVDFKTTPMGGSELEEWRERMESVTGKPLERVRGQGPPLETKSTEAYGRRSWEELVAVAERYGAAHILLRPDAQGLAGLVDEDVQIGRFAQEWVLVSLGSTIQ